MNVHENLSLPEEMPLSTAAPTPSFWFRMLRARLAACVKSWADNHAAATAYDDLSRLSDTQLKHRGLSRDILARDLSAWTDLGSGK